MLIVGVSDARVWADMSEAEPAPRIYLKQSSVSKIEAGSRAISAEDLLYLCLALDKPVEYFFPPSISRELPHGKAAPLEQELLIHATNLNGRDLHQVIAVAKSIADFRPPKEPQAAHDDIRDLEALLGVQQHESHASAPKKRPGRVKTQKKR